MLYFLFGWLSAFPIIGRPFSWLFERWLGTASNRVLRNLLFRVPLPVSAQEVLAEEIKSNDRTFKFIKKTLRRLESKRAFNTHALDLVLGRGVTCHINVEGLAPYYRAYGNLPPETQAGIRSDVIGCIARLSRQGCRVGSFVEILETLSQCGSPGLDLSEDERNSIAQQVTEMSLSKQASTMEDIVESDVLTVEDKGKLIASITKEVVERIEDQSSVKSY